MVPYDFTLKRQSLSDNFSLTLLILPSLSVIYNLFCHNSKADRTSNMGHLVKCEIRHQMQTASATISNNSHDPPLFLKSACRA